MYHDVPRQGGADDSRRDRQSDKWADNVGFAWHAASETWAPMEPVVEEMEVSKNDWRVTLKQRKLTSIYITKISKSVCVCVCVCICMYVRLCVSPCFEVSS